MDRLRAALDSLAGLSVGDAVGAPFEAVGDWPPKSGPDTVPGTAAPPWRWTDDTHMASTVVEALARDGGIDPDALAIAFAQRWDGTRGYGSGTSRLLGEIRDGTPWRTAVGQMFGGQGSCGNGAAMRAAPIGAFFADDPERVVVEATRCAEVTHAHPEGVIGAVAVALATAHARRRVSGVDLLLAVHDTLPASEIRDAIRVAAELFGVEPPVAVRALGNGRRVLAQDTVPFALWVSARHLTDYPAAITLGVRAGGDVDTVCAIAGGIVGAATGAGTDRQGVGVPGRWLAAREPLPAWTPVIPDA